MRLFPIPQTLLALGLVCTFGPLGAQSQARATAPPAQAVSESAVIERIEFRGMNAALQKKVLDQIGVRQGDRLNGESRQRVARGLRALRPGMTFSYRPGTSASSAILVISADC